MKWLYQGRLFFEINNYIYNNNITKLIYKIMCDCQDYIESEGKCFPLLFGRKELNEFVKLFDVTENGCI